MEELRNINNSQKQVIQISIQNGVLSNTVTVVSIFIGVLMSMMGFLLTVTGMKVVKSIVNVGVHKID